MWQPPTPQPPTSQLAKQICNCLSAQYESRTSSWLDRKKQTKKDQVNLVKMFCFNLQQSVSDGLSWFEWTPRVFRDHTSYLVCALSPYKCTASLWQRLYATSYRQKGQAKLRVVCVWDFSHRFDCESYVIVFMIIMMIILEKNDLVKNMSYPEYISKFLILQSFFTLSLILKRD